MKTRFSKSLAQLRRDTSGVAMVEFALALPLMLVTTLYGLEVANLAVTNFRVDQVANMTADLAARVRDRIDEVDVNEAFVGARLSGEAAEITKNGRIILSTLEAVPRPTTPSIVDQTVVWQRCKGKKVPTNTYGKEGDILPTGIGPAGGRIMASVGNPVIFVEVQYDYKPIIPYAKKFLPAEAQKLRYSKAYSVRERNIQAMQNGSNLSNGQKSLCTVYSET
jgi:Flp pilus assembly pilin Flp